MVSQALDTETRELLAEYLRRRSAKAAPMPVCDWIESRVYDPTTVNMSTWNFSQARLIKLEDYQRLILMHALTPGSDGCFPYRTIVWSQPKKSGKTQIAGAVGAWWADQVESPNLILCAANDKEQSSGRVFGAMGPTLYKLTGEFPTAKTAVPEIRLSNGTTVKAIPNNYSGEAGANYGLTLWSELWAYTSERSRRLYEELIPVPTRNNSIRWVETYAGFEDESDLLLELFLKVFQDTSENRLTSRAERVAELGDLPCYTIPDEGLFVFWDHERRMSWQQGARGEKYYKEQAASLRQSAYIRLHENRWQKSAGAFIPDEWWQRSLTLGGPQARPMILAADGSQRNDTTSLVGVCREGERFQTCFVKVWEPHGKNIDLDETLAAAIIALQEQGLIDGPVWYDPFQLHQVAMNLRKRGIACEEFQQGDERLRADSFLYKQYKDGNIDNYADPHLQAHVTAARAKETDNERLRIIKGTMSDAKKIDAAVSQSMAVYKASLRYKRDAPIISPASLLKVSVWGQERIERGFGRYDFD